jgi:hypothetical protein
MLREFDTLAFCVNGKRIAMNSEEGSMSQPAPSQPAPASEPSPEHPEPAFGWTDYAERINGRFAMIGFVALLLLELFTHQDFFSWLGLR